MSDSEENDEPVRLEWNLLEQQERPLGLIRNPAAIVTPVTYEEKRALELWS